MINSVSKKYMIAGIPFTIFYPDNRKTYGDIPMQDYWKYQWSCGYTLANHIMTLDGTDKTFLELGPGLGLCSVVAKYKGFDVTIVDKEPKSLEYTVYNTIINNLSTPRTILNTLTEFKQIDMGTYDIIVAGDLCYRQDVTKDVVTIFKKMIEPDGICYATDQLTENYLIDELPRNELKYTQTIITADLPLELPSGYDRPRTCLYTITK